MTKKRVGIELNQLNQEEALQVDESTMTGGSDGFPKAAPEVLQQRRIVRAKRNTTAATNATTTHAAAVAITATTVIATEQDLTARTTSSSPTSTPNPFANMVIPKYQPYPTNQKKNTTPPPPPPPITHDGGDKTLELDAAAATPAQSDSNHENDTTTSTTTKKTNEKEEEEEQAKEEVEKEETNTNDQSHTSAKRQKTNMDLFGTNNIHRIGAAGGDGGVALGLSPTTITTTAIPTTTTSTLLGSGGFGNTTTTTTAAGFGMISKTNSTPGFGFGSTFTTSFESFKTNPLSTGLFGHMPPSTTTTATTNVLVSAANHKEHKMEETKIVVLPETFSVQTGEEDEECILGPIKCKIFKYVPDTKSTIPDAIVASSSSVPPSKSEDDENDKKNNPTETKKLSTTLASTTTTTSSSSSAPTLVWKNFGVGEIKVLQHKVTQHVRLVQRNGGTTIVLNERLSTNVKLSSTPVSKEQAELRLHFFDSCQMVALKVAKENYNAFYAALSPHVTVEG